MDKEVAGGKAKPEGTLKLRLKLRQGLDPIDSTKKHFPSFLLKAVGIVKQIDWQSVLHVNKTKRK